MLPGDDEGDQVEFGTLGATEGDQVELRPLGDVEGDQVELLPFGALLVEGDVEARPPPIPRRCLVG